MTHFVEKLREMAQALGTTLQQATERLTCHHCTYGVMAGVYFAEALHLSDKSTAGLVAMGVYLIMALRPHP